MNFFGKFIIIIGSLLFSCVSFGFRISPMLMHFAPVGGKATQVLLLENPGSEKIPVQFEVFARGVDSKGEETRIKSDDFTIYPEQVVLLPNEKRNVRVTFSADFKSENEKAYRIVATQIPVEFKERNAKAKKAGVDLNFLLQYVASAYVTPEGATAKIKIKNLKNQTAKSLSMTLVNEGTAHRVLHVKNLKLYSGEQHILDIASPKEIEGINLLAKTEKSIVIPLTKEISGRDLKGELEFSESGD